MMKKVGILTFHRANNHGAVLQCYALQEVLNSLGYKTVVVDYKQPYIAAIYPPLSINRLAQLFMHPRQIYHYIKGVSRRVQKSCKFNFFRETYLNMSPKSCTKDSIPQDVDVYVIGSDQLWGLHCTNGIDPVYFGDFKRSISSSIKGYAISSNLQSIEAIDTMLLGKYINNFSVLSFREQSISNAVLEKCGQKSRVDLDPTLLTDASQWSKIIDTSWKERKYVLLYQVRGSKSVTKSLKEKAFILAGKLGCEVVNLTDSKYSPMDFVSAFKYAQCVITSSFHATVFSILFERPLQAVMLKDGHDARYENLLRVIGAEKMLVDIDFSPEVINYNYAEILSSLSDLKQYSLKYLNTL